MARPHLECGKQKLPKPLQGTSTQLKQCGLEWEHVRFGLFPKNINLFSVSELFVLESLGSPGRPGSKSFTHPNGLSFSLTMYVSVIQCEHVQACVRLLIPMRFCKGIQKDWYLCSKWCSASRNSDERWPGRTIWRTISNKVTCFVRKKWVRQNDWRNFLLTKLSWSGLDFSNSRSQFGKSL